MPKRPPKICRQAGCFRKAEHPAVYCGQHRQEKGDWTDKGSNWSKESRQARGYGREWERLRAWVLNRDLYQCQVCLKQEIYAPATQVDHIKPKSKGGTDESNNLQAICVKCHREKTAREGGSNS